VLYNEIERAARAGHFQLSYPFPSPMDWESEKGKSRLNRVLENLTSKGFRVGHNTAPSANMIRVDWWKRPQ